VFYIFEESSNAVATVIGLRAGAGKLGSVARGSTEFDGAAPGAGGAKWATASLTQGERRSHHGQRIERSSRVRRLEPARPFPASGLGL